MDQFEKGMKTYNNVLQSARSRNDSIGTECHKYNKHYKAWLEKDESKVIQKLEKLKFKKVKATLLARQKAEPPEKEIGEDERHAKLLEKCRQLEKKKLADKLKFDDRLSHIKSVGNGL